MYLPLAFELALWVCFAIPITSAYPPQHVERDVTPYTTDLFAGTRLKESEASLNVSEGLTYTTENGKPYFQPAGAQRAGVSGPLLLQDVHLIDTLAHFARERIPERVVHARGAGAHGVFEVTTDFAERYSVADVFKNGTKTAATVRFSTVGGGRGSADEARDPRGFAIKLRTKKGILDWVFNNTPVFFIRDPAKFRLFIHTQKTDPATNTRSWDVFWSWPAKFPEAMLQFLRLFSDLGTPYGFRHMSGWSGHTYRLVQANGTWVYCRVRLETDQGVKNFTAAEAEKVAGANDAWATQDLYDAIEQGNFPSWTISFQVMTAAQAAAYKYDILDLTKDWLDVPYHEVGKLTLTQNPENYFAEVEQAHFSPGNMVEGWEPSNDPVLQSRLFSYNDAGRYRLGANYLDIPVNCPFSSVANYDRDGHVAVHGNQGSRPNYPSIKDQLNIIARPKALLQDQLQGRVEYYESEINPDIDYEQPRQFYDVQLTQQDRDNLHSNIAGTVINVKDQDIVDMLLEQFGKISNDLKSGVTREMSNATTGLPQPGSG